MPARSSRTISSASASAPRGRRSRGPKPSPPWPRSWTGSRPRRARSDSPYPSPISKPGNHFRAAVRDQEPSRGCRCHCGPASSGACGFSLNASHGRPPVGAHIRKEEPMMRTLAAAGLILMAAGLSGCVTASRYRELEAERDILHTEQERLTQDISQLQNDLSRLETETAALSAKRDSLRSEGDSLRQERDALEGERDALKKAKDDAASHYDALVSQLSQEVKKGNLQIK